MLFCSINPIPFFIRMGFSQPPAPPYLRRVPAPL